MKRISALVVCLLGFSAAAHAATLASPSIFGSHAQSVARCTALNGGSVPITLTVKILTESGAVWDSRTITLAPGDFTALTEPIQIGVAYSCTVTAGVSLANVRAALIIDEPVEYQGSFVPRPIRSAALR